MRITHLDTRDLRFPTSRTLAGSDAVHTDPDYSAATSCSKTDAGVEGHGLAFTLGRGNEICIAAMHALRPLVVGQDLADITTDFAGFWRRLASDSQLRWLGPEKGVIHLALAAIVNAVWDLYAKVAGKPLWKLLADMTPAQIVSCIDFRYITDALTPTKRSPSLSVTRRRSPIAKRSSSRRLSRVHDIRRLDGLLGRTIRALCREAIAEGFTHFKIKVGGAPEDDAARLRSCATRSAPIGS
jgi:L-fuconate dehydratase